MKDYSKFEGPTADELTRAYQHHREKRLPRQDPSKGQGSHDKFVGTPRLQKHKGGRISGVRIR